MAWTAQNYIDIPKEFPIVHRPACKDVSGRKYGPASWRISAAMLPADAAVEAIINRISSATDRYSNSFIFMSQLSKDTTWRRRRRSMQAQAQGLFARL